MLEKIRESWNNVQPEHKTNFGQGFKWGVKRGGPLIIGAGFLVSGATGAYFGYLTAAIDSSSQKETLKRVGVAGTAMGIYSMYYSIPVTIKFATICGVAKVVLGIISKKP